MPQRNFKTLAVWDRSYQSLEQLRNKYGTTFNAVIERLLKMYNEHPQNKVNGLTGKGLDAPRQSKTTSITSIHAEGDTRDASSSSMNGVTHDELQPRVI
jgi:hypothetical protein